MMASQTAATRFEGTPEALTAAGPALPLQERSNGGAGIGSDLANAANPLPLTISLEQLAQYKLITGTITSAVLFAFYEQCFKVFAPGTNILCAPIAQWRLTGILGIKEFYRALQPFGYRYYSRVKFEAARSAQREWIHPTRSEWLLYILVHDQRTQTDRLIRNGALITAKLTGYKPDLQAITAEAAKITAKAEVRRLRERFL
jgi:hypothetical protein